MSDYNKDFIESYEPSLSDEHELEQLTYIGKVNTKLLNIRKEPDIKSEIIYRVENGSELMIEETASTKDWFKICTVSGIEGYCMKKFIDVNK